MKSAMGLCYEMKKERERGGRRGMCKVPRERKREGRGGWRAKGVKRREDDVGNFGFRVGLVELVG